MTTKEKINSTITIVILMVAAVHMCVVYPP